MRNIDFEKEASDRLSSAIAAAGFTFTANEQKNTYLINQVGYQNRSVDARVSLETHQDIRLIQFEATVVEKIASFESALVGVFFGNSKSFVSSFHPKEIIQEGRSGYQIVARAHLYADYYSEAELKAMLQIFVKEVDEIDDELVALVRGEQ